MFFADQIDKYISLQQDSLLFSKEPLPSRKPIKLEQVLIKEEQSKQCFQCLVEGCRRPADIPENLCRHHLDVQLPKRQIIQNRKKVNVKLVKQKQSDIEDVIKQFVTQINNYRCINMDQANQTQKQ